MPDVSLNGIEFEIKGSADAASASVDKLIGKLNNLQTAMNGLKPVQSLAKNVDSVGNAAKKANKPLSNFVSSLKRIAFYRVIRGIIKGITQAFQEGLKNAYEFSKATGDQSGLAASLDKLATSGMQMKNQLGAAFGGLIQAVMPIVLDLIALVTKLASALSALFGMFNGSGGYLQAKEFWTEWGDAAAGAGGSAKKALEYLAPFDELNVLPDPSSGGGGGGGTDFSGMFDWVEFEEGSTGQKISEFVQENLEAIEAISHLFEFAIGLIMVLSNPTSLIGWGLMAYGAYKLWQDGTVNWDAISTQLQGTLGAVTAIVSGFLLVIGILLCVAHAWPLGLGLIAAGAVGLAATVAANWNAITDALQGPIGLAIGLISGAALVLGVLLLLCPGTQALGLGLIASGAAGLATTIAANWDNLVELGRTAIEKVKEGWESVKEAFQMAVQLIKDGWNKVKDWVAEKGQAIGDFVANKVQLIKDGWTKVKDWVKEKGQAASDYVSNKIKLAKEGWKTVSGWIKEGGWGYAVKKGIGVMRDGWTSISGWIKTTWMGRAVSKGIGLAKDGWKYVSSWIRDSFMGKAVSKGIKLGRDGWKFVSSWIRDSWMGKAVRKGIGLMKDKWKTVTSWIQDGGIGEALNKGIGLVKDGWTNVSSWVSDFWSADGSTKLDMAISLVQDGWNTVSGWVKKLIGAVLPNFHFDWTTATKSFHMPWPFDKDITLNIPWPQISFYAKGGIVDSATLFGNNVIGEAGAEAIIPLERHTEWIGKVAEEMNFQLNRDSNNDNVSEDMLYRAFSRALADSDLGGDVNLDGNALYRAMVTRNRQNTRLTGVNAFA